MCRIAGWIGSDINEAQAIRMRDAMHRGGPDDVGVYYDVMNGVWLGHRRLALIDLSPGGHQPKTNQSANLHIVYNGEIYNYKEIKSELSSLGHQFRTQSDTEVILEAYHRWGTACFEKFNGMFALAIYDMDKREIILARDHAGIKPLYYALSNSGLCFASEVKAFKMLNADWPMNKDWKTYFLLFGHLPEPVTTLKGVQPLKKGSWMKYSLSTGQTKKESYIRYKHQIDSTIRLQDALHQVKTLVDQSVQRHLISDAPIGLFLSGGIDSSILTLVANKKVQTGLKTLSIYFEDERYSEKKYQDIIVRKAAMENAGILHESFKVDKKEFETSLPDVMKAMDQPTTDGINTYFISKYAHAYGLKAVLSGIGADELFGGYPSNKMAGWKKVLALVPDVLLKKTEDFTSDRIKKISYLSQHQSSAEYLFYRGLFDFKATAQALDLDEKEVVHQFEQLEDIPWNGETAQEKAAHLEYHMYMQNQLLKDADTMSMWHALELRVPFLDKELYQYVLRIPPSIRFSTVKPKFVLTESFKDVLPTEIWNRPKQGFTFPFSTWMKDIEWTKPQNKTEEGAYHKFVSGQLSWSRYWALVMVR